jgi:hypothetical protein
MVRFCGMIAPPSLLSAGFQFEARLNNLTPLFQNLFKVDQSRGLTDFEQHFGRQTLHTKQVGFEPFR